MPQRFRNFVATVNNPTDEDERAIIAFCSRDNVSYLIYSLEIAPTTGTPHFQLYCELKNQMTHGALKKIFLPDKQPYIAAANGNAQKNYDYIIKKGKPEELPEPTFTFGQPKAPGKRSDLEDIANDITGNNEAKRKLSVAEIAENYPSKFILYNSGIRALVALQLKPYCGGPKNVRWFYGPTGGGKTFTAYHHLSPLETYLHGPEKKHWFQGYTGQPHAVFDEVRFHTLSLGFLLRLTDEYPMQVETKGGFVEFVSDTLTFCSPQHPKDVFAEGSDDDALAQMLRRIKEIRYFPSRGNNAEAGPSSDNA